MRSGRFLFHHRRFCGGLDYTGFLLAGAGIAVVIGFQAIGIASAFSYMFPGVLIWWGLFMSGVHPTLAGVVLGLMTPVVLRRSQEPPVDVVAQALSEFGARSRAPASDVLLGSWLAVRTGLSRLPLGVTWLGLLVVGALAGIGFTMSIFIAMLAFDDANLLGAAKLGILLASFVAAVIGLLLGRVYISTQRRLAIEPTMQAQAS